MCVCILYVCITHTYMYIHIYVTYRVHFCLYICGFLTGLFILGAHLWERLALPLSAPLAACSSLFRGGARCSFSHSCVSTPIDIVIVQVLLMQPFLGESVLQQTSWCPGSYSLPVPSLVMFPESWMQNAADVPTGLGSL